MIVDILERWLEQGPQGDTIDDGRRRTLDALVAATQRRHPVVADLAREVRFGIVDEPLLRAARDAMYEAMEEHLAALVADPAGPQRDDHMAALVDCPQPFAPLLLRRLAVDPPATRPVVLETMTRRYYRRRDPRRRAPVLPIDGRDVVAATMTRAGDGPMHVLTTAAPPAELAAAASTLVEAAEGLPARRDRHLRGVHVGGRRRDDRRSAVGCGARRDPRAGAGRQPGAGGRGRRRRRPGAPRQLGAASDVRAWSRRPTWSRTTRSTACTR